VNEAFAAQVIANKIVSSRRRSRGASSGAPRSSAGSIRKLNVNGGAIALGHPVGATGARLVLTLLRELETKGLRRGLATCVGGGQGAAMVMERR
jgi:acetyl-CoA acetyltransferase